ncbi:family 20 glycosylhydrolase [Lactococcus formosensis]|uniref:Family 20 glycosylhydrolase n=2 Tax=Lactococcus formosensis TaxID=1281486 RepID=A0A9X4NXG8_9LACT|nr:family 20 glycosylhydrolase [Lactococcus formosensis]MDG6127185.1 family 20 glycosylhydrolase [Lactococcus formosensis]MDG6133476.1 family 20 glycosylhydrolase [Lactococcus formosensis]MDG6135531.1 family 20 glycosylhydrolase [Lactococcus formosensis]MDG6141637.1 family 20 glycosylhydrolase [Lactococcus formosensis]MDG6145399.1 family 20 glycosylhydrolase [Lactococcus formosensis]
MNNRKVFSVCAVVGIVVFLMTMINQTEVKAEKNLTQILPEKGIALDISRKFYKAEVIKQFIDDLSNYPNSFLQLHMSDNQNLAVEMATVGQTTDKNAVYQDGQWLNTQTKRPFLSKNDVMDLVSYARSKNVVLIPEIEAPAHMQAILELLKINDPKRYEAIKLPDGAPEQFNLIDYTKVEAIDFVQEMLAEYTPLFAGQAKAYFHIGVDEIDWLPVESNRNLVNYVNTLDNFLKHQGYTTRMWNDRVAKADLAVYNKDIQITYWSQIGGWDINSTDERASSGRQYTASAQELLDAGFQLLNYNAYYTYFLPGQRMWQPESYAYTINDLVANWDLSKFELNSGKQVNSTENVIGSALTFWGEEAGNYTDSQIQQKMQSFVQAYLTKE